MQQLLQVKPQSDKKQSPEIAQSEPVIHISLFSPEYGYGKILLQSVLTHFL